MKAYQYPLLWFSQSQRLKSPYKIFLGNLSLLKQLLDTCTNINPLKDTVEPYYSEPLKCGHLILTDVLLRYGLHSH